MSLYKCFILLILTLQAARSETVDCNFHKEYYGCDSVSRNCSQKSTRFNGDNEFFNCSIGRKDAITTFKKKLNEAADNRFDAPDLLGVSSYWIINETKINETINPMLAIEVTFRMPHAILTNGKDNDATYNKKLGYGENRQQEAYNYPKAIFLNFSSVRDKSYQDPFYYQCPRERIFIFHNYSPLLHYDVDNPRNISYRCMFGLYFMNQNNAYKMSLSTAEGRTRDFYITLPVRYIGMSTWRPAVATCLDVDQRTIQVIVEPQPTNFRSPGYQVTLCTHDNVCGPSKQISGRKTNSSLFENIAHGVYFLKVVSSTCAANYQCQELVSYKIDATEIPANADSPLHYLAEVKPVQIIIMVVGSVVGVVLLVVVAYCIRRGRSCARNQEKYDQKPQGIVIHPFLDVTSSNGNTDRKYVQVLEDFQHFVKKAFDCELAPIPVGCLNGDKTPLNKLFSGLTFAMVVCSDNNSNPCFQTLLMRAVQKRTKENNLFIIPVTFSCFPSPYTPECIADVHTIRLIQNIHDLSSVYNKIHALHIEEDDSSRLIESYINCQEYKRLEQSIKDASPLFPFRKPSTVRNKETSVDGVLPSPTKCESADYQHNPYEPDIVDGSPEKKRTEAALILRNLGKFNESSTDIFYNGARPKENSRELPATSETLRCASNANGVNQGIEKQSDQQKHLRYQPASQYDSGKSMHLMTEPQWPIFNENAEVHINRFPVPHRSDIPGHHIRSIPRDYDDESVLLPRGHGPCTGSNAPFPTHVSSVNCSHSFEHQRHIEKVSTPYVYNNCTRGQHDINMHHTERAHPRAEDSQYDCKHNQFNEYGMPVFDDQWCHDMHTRQTTPHSRDPYLMENRIHSHHIEQNIHSRSLTHQNFAETCDVASKKEEINPAAAKTPIYFPALDNAKPDVHESSALSGKIRKLKLKASSAPCDLNTIPDWIPPDTGSILVGNDDEVMEKMNKINENYN